MFAAQKKLRKRTMIILVALSFALQPSFSLAEDLEGSENDSSGSKENNQSVVESGDVSVEAEVENDINQNKLEDSSSDSSEETTDKDSPETDEDNNSEEMPEQEEENNDTQNSTSSAETKDDSNPEEKTSTSTDNPVDPFLDDYSTSSDSLASSSADKNMENNSTSTLENEVRAEGTSGENETEETEGDAIVDSGDIDVKTKTDNDINKNDIEDVCLDCQGNTDDASSSAEIENNSQADLENKTGITATSGDNYVATSEDAYIKSGNISILNIIVNFINTNFIGNGREFLVNIFDKASGNLDLSGYSEAENPVEKNNCSEPGCRINVENNSTSTIKNQININAESGGNVIATTSGGGVIESGDIDIVNDILNIANLNVSGEDWFFGVVNIFGEMQGDVIMPAFKQLEGASSTASSSEKDLVKKETEISSEFVISNKNNAKLKNDINVQAESGENSASGTAENIIVSGDIENKSQVLNFINYNISGDSWKFARINVFGSWQGIINGLPEAYDYYEDEQGITIYNEFLDDPYLTEYYAQLAVDNYNNASTSNEINIEANSGNNSILHSEEPNLIKSGYIKIKNSLLNFLNSNFSGNNWEFSMVNVFGDWKGNLDFGQPELWMTVSADKKQVEENEYVTYTFLYGNNGDASARDVYLADDYDDRFLSVAERGGGEEREGRIVWSLGDIPPNSQGSFSYTTVADNVPEGTHKAENNSEIISPQGERDFSNNSGRVNFSVSDESNYHGVQVASRGKSSFTNLSIVKSNDATDELYPGDVVNFTLDIKNTGSRDAREVFVLDVMSEKDSGEEIYRDFWNLGTVYAGEEILIEYSLEISEEVASGTYINEALVEGYDSGRRVYVSAAGSSRNKIVNDEVAEEPAPAPNISISRVGRSSFANPGGTMDFEIIVANNGLADAHELEVVEELPEFMSYADSVKDVGSWYYDVLRSGEIKNIKYKLAISEKASTGFYLSSISVRGEDFPEERLESEIEVREPVVLALGGGEADSQDEKDSGEEFSTPAGSSVREIQAGKPAEEEPEKLKPDSQDKEGEKKYGQVLGVSNDDIAASPSDRTLYIIFSLLLIFLILLFIAIFFEKDEERGKLF